MTPLARRKLLSDAVDWRFDVQGGWRAFTTRHQPWATTTFRSAGGTEWIVTVARPTGLGHLTSAAKPLSDATGGPGLSTNGSSWLVQAAHPPAGWRSTPRTVLREYVGWDALVIPMVNALVAALLADVPLPD